MPSAINQGLRYAAAIVLSSCLAPIVVVPFAFAIDILWGGDVTGGRWPLTAPNVLLTIIQALLTGFIAGWIAGRRGKLIAAFSTFFLMFALTVYAISINRDIFSGLQTDTKPADWAWIGLLPAMLAGHLAVKYKPLGIVSVLAAIGMMMALMAQLGAAAFHLYTVVMAYNISGIGSAGLALFMPLISQLWWTWWIWGITHTFWNVYTLRFALLIIWGSAAFAVTVWATYVSEKRQSRRAISEAA